MSSEGSLLQSLFSDDIAESLEALDHDYNMQGAYDQVGIQAGSMQQQQPMSVGMQMAPQNVPMQQQQVAPPQQQYMRTPQQQMVMGAGYPQQQQQPGMVMQQQPAIAMAPRMPGNQRMMRGPMMQQQQVMNGPPRALGYPQMASAAAAARLPSSTYVTPPKLHHIDQEAVYSAPNATSGSGSGAPCLSNGMQAGGGSGYWSQASVVGSPQPAYAIQAARVGSPQRMGSPGPHIAPPQQWPAAPPNGQMPQPSSAAGQAVSGYAPQCDYARPAVSQQQYQYMQQQQQQGAGGGIYVQSPQSNLLPPQMASPGGRNRTPSGQMYAAGSQQQQPAYAPAGQLAASNSGVYQPMSPMQNPNTSPHHQLQPQYSSQQQRAPQGYLSPNRPSPASPLHRPTPPPMTTPPPCAAGGLTPPPPAAYAPHPQSQGAAGAGGGSLQQLEQMVAPGGARGAAPNPFLTIVQPSSAPPPPTATYTQMNAAKVAPALTAGGGGGASQLTTLVITVTPGKGAPAAAATPPGGADLRNVNQNIAREIQQLRQQIQQLRGATTPDQPKIDELSTRVKTLAAQLQHNLQRQQPGGAAAAAPAGQVDVDC
ncbi:PREDICTED: trithorax group protein osa-like [Priapulus caudatus]|uniref:Trithorax group protein osa-like n=1 Tax=Priapulus caudatus TaxID=37621 RepID=A0ABM1ECN8_PRICU|nr:PREDICTED: trithorax group protein osa-like [Priapulus caudatus]